MIKYDYSSSWSSTDAKLRTNRTTTASSGLHDISLVISFWAGQKEGGSYAQSNPHHAYHRREVEAAILTNLQNPHFHQVVVILDSVNENTTDCHSFVQYMNQRLDAMRTRSSWSFFAWFLTTTHNHASTLPQLECIERRGEESAGQPTYFEMFQYATYHPSITSEIVILSNADQAFDETLSHAKNISDHTIFVLSTRGYGADRVPIHVRKQYQTLVGDDTHEEARKRSNKSERCMDRLYRGTARGAFSNSWDTYIFHRSLLSDTLRRVDDAGGDDGRFTRLNFWRNRTSYFMNELGAENAALYDITRDLLGNVTVWNACKLIRTWHFHLAPKMHHAGNEHQWPEHSSRLGGGYVFYQDYGPLIPQDGITLTSRRREENAPGSQVPPPVAYAPLCMDAQSCYSDNRLSGKLFIGKQTKDATEFRVAMPNTTDGSYDEDDDDDDEDDDENEDDENS